MAFIITLAGQKGGTGKSTLALCIADAIAAEGQGVALVELDRQGSLAGFNRLASIPLTDCPDTPAGLHSLAPFVVVDTAPYFTPELPGVLAVTSVVIVPIRPGVSDVQALGRSAELVKASGRPALVVLNGAKPATAGHVAEIRAIAQTYGLPVAETVIADRLAYTRAPLSGGLTHAPTPDAKALAEITALLAEAVGLAKT